MSMENSLNTLNGLFSQYLEAYKVRTEIYSRLVNIAEANNDPAKRKKDTENTADVFIKAFFKNAENLTKPAGKSEENTTQAQRGGVIPNQEKSETDSVQGAKLNEAENQKIPEEKVPADDTQEVKPDAEKADINKEQGAKLNEGQNEKSSEGSLFGQSEEAAPDPRSFPIQEEKPSLSEGEIEALRTKARSLCNAFQLKYGRQAAKEMVFAFGQGSVIKMSAEHLQKFIDYVGAKLNEAEGLV